MRSMRWLWLVVVVVVGWIVLTSPGRAAANEMIASLRLARPAAVHVTVPAFSGPTGTRRLQDAVAAMLADSVHVLHESAVTPSADVAAAAERAGFTPVLPSARHDVPTFSVESARTISMVVNRSELQTILAEAGRSGTSGEVPASVDGAVLRITTPAAVRVSYGHCPVADSSLQTQLAGPPPSTGDNTNCIILVERHSVNATVPAGLDMTQLVAVALEVAGMSPKQAADFQQMFDWHAALALTMPRFMRSSDTVSVNGAPGMLLNTQGRRGPTYDLIWAKDGVVYTLTGFGSSADAAPLASSVR